MRERVVEHRELPATVRDVVPWGVLVTLPGGVPGLVDQAKSPGWRSGSAPPLPGDVLWVVVLDGTRDPVRVSALAEDREIARRLRDRTWPR
ncbi:hypothetical protein RM844_30060 [Streptomyces sp. DSM 44915]|uniref:S1 motif domain-containing protein n=1 Tax=Streptomyces chisholmiae TaxID=3075540 RepID=A0ABU2JZV6_9ACTN|nr:hypothetical protein [Streptomyces sp. DSM 44915]MDT0270525.1 hypothetical protein [Streptomyces sp. DSM 44915]